jgi:hypothetical protein
VFQSQILIPLDGLLVDRSARMLKGAPFGEFEWTGSASPGARVTSTDGFPEGLSDHDLCDATRMATRICVLATRLCPQSREEGENWYLLAVQEKDGGCWTAVFVQQKCSPAQLRMCRSWVAGFLEDCREEVVGETLRRGQDCCQPSCRPSGTTHIGDHERMNETSPAQLSGRQSILEDCRAESHWLGFG